MGVHLPLTSDDLRRVIDREMGALMRENEELREALAQREHQRLTREEETDHLAESLRKLTEQVDLIATSGLALGFAY